MTGPEWQAELVRLCVEAIDAADAASLTEGAFIVTAKGRELVLAHLRERMAQAAQAIVIEIEGARGAESARLDRIDATARALYAASWPMALTSAAGASAADHVAQGAYLHAELLENARAEWLAKRGQR